MGLWTEGGFLLPVLAQVGLGKLVSFAPAFPARKEVLLVNRLHGLVLHHGQGPGQARDTSEEVLELPVEHLTADVLGVLQGGENVPVALRLAEDEPGRPPGPVTLRL